MNKKDLRNNWVVELLVHLLALAIGVILLLHYRTFSERLTHGML
jgi:hypothetical protein